MSDTYLAAIGKLREELDENITAIKQDSKMAEVLRLHSALNVMENLLGQPKTSLSEVFGLEQNLVIHPGEFYGMSSLKAAKRYLKKRGKAAAFREIVEAVRAGGAIKESEDKLRVSLGRSTSDIVKLDAEHYGLIEFYPDAKRGKKKKPVSEGGQVEEFDSEDSELEETAEESDSELDSIESESSESETQTEKSVSL